MYYLPCSLTSHVDFCLCEPSEEVGHTYVAFLSLTENNKLLYKTESSMELEYLL